MVAVLVVVGVVVVLGLGFYFTRGAGGPPPLDGEGRLIDAESRAGPLGKPMPWAEDVPQPSRHWNTSPTPGRQRRTHGRARKRVTVRRTTESSKPDGRFASVRPGDHQLAAHLVRLLGLGDDRA